MINPWICGSFALGNFPCEHASGGMDDTETTQRFLPHEREREREKEERVKRKRRKQGEKEKRM